MKYIIDLSKFSNKDYKTKDILLRDIEDKEVMLALLEAYFKDNITLCLDNEAIATLSKEIRAKVGL